jgi:hypothetical protein
MTEQIPYPYFCKVTAVIPCNYYETKFCMKTCAFSKELELKKESKLVEALK